MTDTSTKRKVVPLAMALALVLVFEARLLPAPISYRATALGTLGGSSINASGQITGSFHTAEVSFPPFFHAFLYSGGIMTDLGTLGGTLPATASNISQGFSINASGQITGFSFTRDNEPHAFLYSGGSMYDLNDLVSDGLPDGVTLQFAPFINDSGWIIASGEKTYLLQPVPEPASLALFAIGAGALAVLRMRRA